mmetsp:Transcript_46602/g.93280  ORF Transcript_46602/g.93280 Transcript_46602/m.93280 type:complete len:328 (-) Transcript_46602:649-1632(-)
MHLLATVQAGNVPDHRLRRRKLCRPLKLKVKRHPPVARHVRARHREVLVPQSLRHHHKRQAQAVGLACSVVGLPDVQLEAVQLALTHLRHRDELRRPLPARRPERPLHPQVVGASSGTGWVVHHHRRAVAHASHRPPVVVAALQPSVAHELPACGAAPDVESERLELSPARRVGVCIPAGLDQRLLNKERRRRLPADHQTSGHVEARRQHHEVVVAAAVLVAVAAGRRRGAVEDEALGRPGAIDPRHLELRLLHPGPRLRHGGHSDVPRAVACAGTGVEVGQEGVVGAMQSAAGEVDNVWVVGDDVSRDAHERPVRVVDRHLLLRVR